MQASAIVVLILLQQLGSRPTGFYDDVVRLENRASQERGPRGDVDRIEAIRIAQKLGRPRLVAVLYKRLGRNLESINIQNAVIACESGLRALKNDRTLKIEEVLHDIARLPKGYTATPAPLATDLYSETIDKQ